LAVAAAGPWASSLPHEDTPFGGRIQPSSHAGAALSAGHPSKENQKLNALNYKLAYQKLNFYLPAFNFP
jgi:hypothetical protein